VFIKVIIKTVITIPQTIAVMAKDFAMVADLLASSYFISAASFCDCDRKLN
jgi:hypothetical protein